MKQKFINLKPKFSVNIVCQVAILIALTFVLERYLSFNPTPTFRISLAFVPIACCGMLFGPLWGALAYGLADVLGWPIMGQVPIPLILVSRVVEGFIYGLILHREKLRFAPHAIINALSVQLVCGAGLTTLGLSLFYGLPFLPLLVSRLLQLGVIVVFQLAVFPLLVRVRNALQRAGLD